MDDDDDDKDDEKGAFGTGICDEKQFKLGKGSNIQASDTGGETRSTSHVLELMQLHHISLGENQGIRFHAVLSFSPRGELHHGLTLTFCEVRLSSSSKTPKKNKSRASFHLKYVEGDRIS